MPTHRDQRDSVPVTVKQRFQLEDIAVAAYDVEGSDIPGIALMVKGEGEDPRYYSFISAQHTMESAMLLLSTVLPTDAIAQMEIVITDTIRSMEEQFNRTGDKVIPHLISADMEGAEHEHPEDL